MKFCDLEKQYQLLKEEIDRRMAEVVSSCRFINGPEVAELEGKCAEYTGVKQAIGVASGTDALLVSLMAFDIKPGDFVITTPFTFIATAEVISLLKARPLFVDIDEQTYNISPKKIEALLKSPLDPKTKEKIEPQKIKGIIAVDLFGQTADYDMIRLKIDDFYQKTGQSLFLIEDGAQSFGATYCGRKACSLGDVSCTSFFPAKPLGCYGDGGMVFTDNEQLAVKMCWIRNHGQNKRYNHKLIGLNARLDTLQAAVVLAKFDQFVSKEIDLRRRVADKYIEKLQKKDIRGLVLPDIKPENESVWAQFSIRVKEKAGLLEALKNKGIPTAVHYPKPLHLQEAFSAEGYRPGSFPVAEKVSEEIMSLPMHPYLTDEEIALVAEEIDRFFKK